MAINQPPYQLPQSPYGDPTSGGIYSKDRINLGSPYDDMDEDQREKVGFDDDEEDLAKEIESIKTDQMDYLARKVFDEFSIDKGARIIQEQTWIRAHMNIKGKYPGDMDFNSSTSRAFVQVTRPRVQTAAAMLIPIILPPGDKSWTLDPTPFPSMPKISRMLVSQGVQPEIIIQNVRRAAEIAADKMSNRVDDGLVETGWPFKLARTIIDMCTYGTSVLYGPLARKCERIYEDDDVSELEALGIEDRYTPEMEVISPFDFYPDPGGRTIEECSHAIIRKVMNRNQLRELRKRESEGFRSKAIDDVLQRNPDGNWTPEYWESTINISNDQQQMTAPNGRFVVLVRWGWLSGRDLSRAGIPVPEDLMEEQVMAQVWVVAGNVISLRVSDLHKDRLPFYVTPFSIVPHCIWGSGVAEHMFDSQDAINATERAKMDNMALINRPQVIVNVDRLKPGENPLEQRAGKVWTTRESEINNGDAIKWQVPVNALNEIRAIQGDSMQLSQEQTALPNLLMGMGGEGTHNRTLGGASMQFNAAITPLKSVIFNVENFMIVPMITSHVRFHTLYSNDETIKGDYKVNARGVSGLMAREVLTQRLTQFMQVAGANPAWAEKIDMDRVFELLVRDSGMTDAHLTIPDEIVRQRKAEEESQKQTSVLEQIQAKGNMDAKLKAETAPKDALLEALKAAPQGSKTKMALIHETMQVFGILTPEVEEAINQDLQMADFVAKNQAHELGTMMQERGEYGLQGPPEGGPTNPGSNKGSSEK